MSETTGKVVRAKLVEEAVELEIGFNLRSEILSCEDTVNYGKIYEPK